MNHMSALVKTAPDKTELLSVPVPECGVGQVLLKIRAAALCGTDLHLVEWNSWAQQSGIQLPTVLGHECCGDVIAVGPGVKTVHPGDRVAVETHVPCGECYQCLNGEQHICANLKLFGVHMNGCFAEYAVVPAACARRIPEGISDAAGAIMEPLGTAVRAAYETQAAGARVMVLGCGPIGLFAVAAAACMGAARIFATDVSPERMAIARELGAKDTLHPLRQSVRDFVREATGGCGVDVVIEASGNADAIKESFQYLRKGGRMALIGLPGKPLELELGREVVFKEAKLIGIHGRRMYETWSQMENLLEAGKLAIDPVITHRLPLSKWQEGIELAKTGRACKVIFHPGE